MDSIAALPRLSQDLKFIVQTSDIAIHDHMMLVSRQDCGVPSTSHRNIPCSTTTGRSTSTTRVQTQYRAENAPQTVQGASVYLYYIPPPSATRTIDQVLAELEAELRSHYPVLRASPKATLVVVIHLLPEPGVLSGSVESNLRTMDILLHQLTNQRLLEEQDILNALNHVCDRTGRLVLVKKSIDRYRPVTVLEIKAEVFPTLSA